MKLPDFNSISSSLIHVNWLWSGSPSRAVGTGRVSALGDSEEEIPSSVGDFIVLGGREEGISGWQVSKACAAEKGEGGRRKGRELMLEQMATRGRQSTRATHVRLPS